MTVVGLLAFFGIAVMAVDVLGGFIAAGLLAKGVQPRHLWWFVLGYAVPVTIAVLILKPLLDVAGRWLAPVLGSATAMAVIQLVIGLILLGVAYHQRRTADQPKPPKPPRTKDRVGSLLAGGAAFSVTVLAHPFFPVIVAMAGQMGNMVVETLLIIAWMIVYQFPFVAVMVAGFFGWHERLIAWFARILKPRRRVLLLILAVGLAVFGAAAIIDAIIALASHHHPVLETALQLRKRA